MFKYLSRLLDSQDRSADSITFLGLLAGFIMLCLFVYSSILFPNAINWIGFGTGFSAVVVGVGGGKAFRDGWNKQDNADQH